MINRKIIICAVVSALMLSIPAFGINANTRYSTNSNRTRSIDTDNDLFIDGDVTPGETWYNVPSHNRVRSSNYSDTNRYGNTTTRTRFNTTSGNIVNERTDTGSWFGNSRNARTRNSVINDNAWFNNDVRNDQNRINDSRVRNNTTRSGINSQNKTWYNSTRSARVNGIERFDLVRRGVFDNGKLDPIDYYNLPTL